TQDRAHPAVTNALVPAAEPHKNGLPARAAVQRPGWGSGGAPSPRPVDLVPHERHDNLAVARLAVAFGAALTFELLQRVAALLIEGHDGSSRRSSLASRALIRMAERLKHEQVGAIAAGVLAACGGLA